MTGLRAFVSDMISSTKIGRKWQAGIEKFMEEIQAETRRVAMVNASVIGQYSEARTELRVCLPNGKPKHGDLRT